MKVVVQVVEKIISEAHIRQFAIRNTSATLSTSSQLAIVNEIIVSSLKTQLLNLNYGKTHSINIQAHAFIHKLLTANCELVLSVAEVLRIANWRMTPDLNIFQVDFESISATIVQQPQEIA
ncbi:MAG: hypothetical protein V7K26_16105 [Nostoc sp.]|uniref:hypothetical protein n=1 Tax=Nostoc sp. TaxID=1180 RepID=UPI002FF004FC